MTKNNKGGKVIQMLSPENYIRKKSRSLPLHECLTNRSWEDEGIAQIVISRKHINGNITYCSYLVDLLCLGVKDTFFQFNVPEFEFYEFKEQLKEDIDLISITYTLAHNIIFTAIEFADEFGFKPCKTFTSTTQYFLENDDDKIEIVEVECGREGKPIYIETPFETESMQNKIATQLEKIAGPGNYEILNDYDDYNFDDDEYPKTQYDDLPFDEKKSMFINLTDRLDSVNINEVDQLHELTFSLINHYSKKKSVLEYYETFADQFRFHILYNDDIPDQLLGAELSNHDLASEIKEGIYEIYELALNNLQNAKKALKKLLGKAPDVPALAYLDLMILEFGHSKKLSRAIDEYYLKYPNYPLIKLQYLFFEIGKEERNINLEEIAGYPFNPIDIFPDRDSLHEIELYRYLYFYMFYIGQTNNLDKLLAFNILLMEVGLSQRESESLSSLLFITELGIINNLLRE